MSAVWLQIGQCGNQIGQEWWQIVTSTSSREADIYPFCSQDGHLSAICVDSEPKVVRKLQKQVKRGVFRESNLIMGKQGRGSNWAYGYHGVRSEGEESLCSRTMESLRKEAEKRDFYGGTVLFHSLSGGTGAGLSSRLCEAIREEYPLGRILSVSVAPHKAGESPLQHYNALLCLSWLQSGVNMGMEPWELLRTVCPMPAFKFLHTAQASTRGTVFWDSLASSVLQPLPRQSLDGNPHQSTAVLAVARGPREDAFLANPSLVLRKLRQGYRCVAWNPFAATYWTDAASLMAPGRHSLTVCANHSSSADLLQRVEQRARAMYESNAFLHWYWRHGCEEGDFEQAFETVRSVLGDYSHLGE
ncbi:uncharacterized protein LOC128423868 isoform X4 [Podarcis raffonei]|uniref:uncharacterized protein LOC128423868 isoform X4 n=1 Tax=Podarcis raffonei TaxID=65483 RepID=UPI0023294AC6|nr:uncharacterized protein LOC128423868 isoform X4 [Podarcis raffonei]